MRVLVADDDEQVLQTLARILTEAGYDVMTAEDGARALALAQANPPDLILTDLDMPHISGLDLLAALKADPSLASIPVAILSANADPAQISRATTLGAGAYLIKPASAAEILQAVQSLLP